MRRYIIRKLNREDKADLDMLVNRVESNLADITYWLPITDVSREHFFDEEWTVFIGAYDENRLVGAVGLFLNDNEYGESQRQIHYENVKIAEYGRAMVDPDYRGEGIMNCLLEEMNLHIKEHGIEYVIATVHPDNMPSQKALVKAGFEKKGHIIKGNGKYPRDILIKKVD